MLKLMKDRPIIIICGDPESTFNEILIKTLKSKAFRNFKFPIIIICSEKLFQNELKKLKTKINLQKFENQNKLLNNKIYIIDIPLKKGNLPLMDALQIEGMTYLVIEGLERNGTGFKVDTPYIEKIYGLKADVEYYIGERIIGKDTFETFYIEKIGGEQGSPFSDLTSHVDSRIRDKINIRPWQFVLEALCGYLVLAQSLHKNIGLSDSWNFGPKSTDCKKVEWIVKKFRKKFDFQFSYLAENSMHETKLLKLDISKSKRKLNWQPIISINKAVNYTSEWYEKKLKGSNEYEISLEQIKLKQ